MNKQSCRAKNSEINTLDSDNSSLYCLIFEDVSKARKTVVSKLKKFSCFRFADGVPDESIEFRLDSDSFNQDTWDKWDCFIDEIEESFGLDKSSSCLPEKAKAIAPTLH
jgi:hypothetical protein